jgi:DNA-binding transcriptional MocR family regulator
MHTSGISQAIALKLLTYWGETGFRKHIRRVQLFYKRRRDAAIASAERHLSDVAEWGVPEAGKYICGCGKRAFVIAVRVHLWLR